MLVKIETLKNIAAFKEELNSCKLSQIVLEIDGKKYKLTTETIEYFEMVGFAPFYFFLDIVDSIKEEYGLELVVE